MAETTDIQNNATGAPGVSTPPKRTGLGDLIAEAITPLLGDKLAKDLTGKSEEKLEQVAAENPGDKATIEAAKNIADGKPPEGDGTESGEASEEQSVSKGFGGILGKVFESLGIDPAFAAILVTAITTMFGAKEDKVKDEHNKSLEAEKAAAKKAEEAKMMEEIAAKAEAAKQADALAAQQKAEKAQEESAAKLARDQEEAAKAVEVAANAKLVSEQGLIPNDFVGSHNVEKYDPSLDLAKKNEQDAGSKFSAIGAALVADLKDLGNDFFDWMTNPVVKAKEMGESLAVHANAIGGRIDGGPTRTPLGDVGGRGEGASLGGGGGE